MHQGVETPWHEDFLLIGGEVGEDVGYEVGIVGVLPFSHDVDGDASAGAEVGCRGGVVGQATFEGLQAEVVEFAQTLRCEEYTLAVGCFCRNKANRVVNGSYKHAAVVERRFKAICVAVVNELLDVKRCAKAGCALALRAT